MSDTSYKALSLLLATTEEELNRTKSQRDELKAMYERALNDRDAFDDGLKKAEAIISELKAKLDEANDCIGDWLVKNVTKPNQLPIYDSLKNITNENAKLRAELASLRKTLKGYEKTLDQALNEGDGVYRP